MSNHLTLRQLKFIQIYIETGNATKAAMKAYSCKNENTAAVLGHENLRKPKIACEIEKYRKKGGLSIEKAVSAINDAYDAEKKGSPDHNVRLRSADMTLKLADAYPKNREVHHKHAHLHLEAIKEFSQLPFDDLTRLMEQEAGLAPGTLAFGNNVDMQDFLSPGGRERLLKSQQEKASLPEQEQPIEPPNKTPLPGRE